MFHAPAREGIPGGVWLVVDTGGQRGRAVPVGEEPCTIGSAPGRTLQLDDAGVAPLHAALRTGQTGALELVPLDLHARLTLQGVPLTGTVRVREGGRIGVGDVVLRLTAEPPQPRAADQPRRRRWPVPWR